MIQKIKDLEEQAMDELNPEDYDNIKDLLLGKITNHEQALYKSGYIDGLRAAILAASEDSSDHSYTLNIDDLFD
tara:strand:- start:176 stop:397 length:222 start_codon:yes stop_codon:yes gene_type:complete